MLKPENVLHQFMPQLNAAGKVFLAFSGGLDSSCLLHMLSALNIDCTLIHVNHHLSPNASAWEAHCLKCAHFYQRKIIIESADNLHSTGEGLEQAARDARYELMARHIQPGDVLLTAHHQNDQAETVFFRLLRGGGLTGLSGMRPQREFAAGDLLRPLLAQSRSCLESYAAQNNLSWVEDESNQNLRFHRNFLRQKIFPQLEAHWPGFRKRVAQTAVILGESAALLREYAEADMVLCARRQERLGESLNLQKLLHFSAPRRHGVVRTWMASQGFNFPTRAQLHEVEKLTVCRSDGMPLVRAGNCEFRRFKNRIFCMRQQAIFNPREMPWDGKQNLQLPDGSILQNLGPESNEYIVRFRQGGERCQPSERPCSQSLKKLLQEYALEPWLRERIPLIYCNGELLAVGDLFSCAPDLRFRWFYVR